MLKKLLRKPREKAPSAISTLERLHEASCPPLISPLSRIFTLSTLEMLEKKENLLQKKISKEVEKAKDYTKTKNKKAAIQCLKKKKMYELQMEQLGVSQLRVHDQMIMLEGLKATTDTVDALRIGAAAMKTMQKSLSVDEIDKTMEEVNEHAEHMKEIQEAVATPMSASAEFDEDELEAELEELEEAELEEPVQPSPAVPAEQLPTSHLPKREPPQSSITSNVDELAALQAEMAL